LNICVSSHYKKLCSLFLCAIAYSDCYRSLSLAHGRFDSASIYIYVLNPSHSSFLGAKPLFVYPSSQIRSDSTRMDQDWACVLGFGSPKRPLSKGSFGDIVPLETRRSVQYLLHLSARFFS
jgi:hypothetical protein